jgi:hypothetical protein
MKKGGKIVIAIYLAAFLALYAVIFIAPEIVDAMQQTAVLEYGSLSISDEVTGYVVRKETVYLADQSGEIRYYVGEGVKIRKGIRLLDIVASGEPAERPKSDLDPLRERIGGNGVALTANVSPEGGVISFYSDGYETIFSPETIGGLTKRQAETAAAPVQRLTRDSGVHVLKGEPMYKIVDDALWYMIFWLDGDSSAAAHYETGKSVTARLPGGEVRGKIESVTEQGEMRMIRLAFDRYYEELTRTRSIEATVVTADYSGLIAESDSIVSEDGQSGVYARRKNGNFEFVPVNEIHSENGQSVLSASTFTGKDGREVRTVNVYEEILRDPPQAQ